MTSSGNRTTPPSDSYSDSEARSKIATEPVRTDTDRGSLFGARKRVYLSGPISLDGRASTSEIEANIQRFHDEQTILAAAGCDVLSPLANGLPAESSWADHMRADIAMLMQADEILLLPRWQESRGSTLELFIATQVGIPSREA